MLHCMGSLYCVFWSASILFRAGLQQPFAIVTNLEQIWNWHYGLAVGKRFGTLFFPLIIQSHPGHPCYQPGNVAAATAAAAAVFAYYVIRKLSLQNVQLGEPPFFMATFFSI